MRTRYPVMEPLAAQFVTSTVVGWLPVFTSEVRCQIVVDALEHCREQKRLKVYGRAALRMTRLVKKRPTGSGV